MQELQSVFGLSDSVSAGVLDLSVSLQGRAHPVGPAELRTQIIFKWLSGQQGAESVLCSCTHGHHTQSRGPSSDSLAGSLPANFVSHNISRSVCHCHCRHWSKFSHGVVGYKDCYPILECEKATALWYCRHAPYAKRPAACSNERSCTRQHSCAASDHHLGSEQPFADPSRLSKDPFWRAQKLSVPESRRTGADHQRPRPCLLLVADFIICVSCHLTHTKTGVQTGNRRFHHLSVSG